ncbi:hypothetical protein Tco_0477583 [Tanacetum coccineum]
MVSTSNVVLTIASPISNVIQPIALNGLLQPLELSWFLRENNVTINTSESNASNAPVANVIMSGSPSASPTWLFDSGASSYVTGDRSTLQNVSDCGGPDEIILGNGNSLKISHDLRTGARLMRGENFEDVYYAKLPSKLQLNVTTPYT